MAERNLRGLIIMVIVAGLFMYAMIFVSVQMGLDNDANQSLLDNERISRAYGNLTTQLQRTQGVSESQREQFETEEPQLEAGGVLFKSIVTTGTTFISMFTGFFNIIIGVLATVLGVNIVILSVIVSITLITLIFWAWRTYKSGE